jgi:peptidoglycan/xylan/chitin deacetylase (PgdA/CDA1 family)
VPYTLTTNDRGFWRPPGYADPSDFYHQLKAAFDWLYREGETSPKMMSVGLHLRYCGRPGRAAAVDRFLAYASGFPDVWFARRADIATWWLENHPDSPVLSS